MYVRADLAYCVYHLLVVIFYHEGAQFGIEKLINITIVWYTSTCTRTFNPCTLLGAPFTRSGYLLIVYTPHQSINQLINHHGWAGLCLNGLRAGEGDPGREEKLVWNNIEW